MFPSDPKVCATQVAPVGALRSWLERDAKSPVPAYVANEVSGGVQSCTRTLGFSHHEDRILRNGTMYCVRTVDCQLYVGIR